MAKEDKWENMQVNSRNPREQHTDMYNGNNYITSIDGIQQLSAEERARLAQVEEKYPFRASEYYLSLIDWNDPQDPLRRLIIPDLLELEQWGDLDPSREESYSVMRGMEHKYTSTVLLLVSGACAGICRYCFRKRVFIQRGQEILPDVKGVVDYLNSHREVTNVILSGGDPLMLSTDKLEKIIDPLCGIEHVRIIRIGTKVTSFNPFRILNDEALRELFSRCNQAGKQLYLMTHFSHPRELTDLALESVKALHRTGAITANQTPLISGVNDNVDVLAELFSNLSFAAIPPYYVFQCRPASGNKGYALPVEKAYEIFEQAQAQVSGLAKRARFTMSHQVGKIEVVGLDRAHIFFRFHRATVNEDSGKFMVFRRSPQAYWFDDYHEAVHIPPGDLCYQSYGPD